MKIPELRSYLKERGVRGFSTLKKTELEAKVQKIKEKEKAEKYEENLKNTALCSTCLEQQRIQRKIDSKTHDQRLFDSVVRTLVCEYCQHVEVTIDGDHNFCTGCGTLQDPNAVGGYRN